MFRIKYENNIFIGNFDVPIFSIGVFPYEIYAFKVQSSKIVRARVTGHFYGFSLISQIYLNFYVWENSKFQCLKSHPFVWVSKNRI